MKTEAKWALMKILLAFAGLIISAPVAFGMIFSIPDDLQSIDLEVRVTDASGQTWTRLISAGDSSFEIPETLQEPLRVEWRARRGAIAECSNSFDDELLRLQCEARTRASKIDSDFQEFPTPLPAIKPQVAPRVVETEESLARRQALEAARRERLAAIRAARAARLEQEKQKRAEKAALAAELAKERARLAGLARDRESALKAMKRGFQSLAKRRYDLSLNDFLRASAARELLAVQDRSALDFGLGVSSFHQKGCAIARPELIKAQVVAKYQPDASYYLALCDVEEQRFKTAEATFKRFVLERHPDYAEASRFYLGVISDSRDEYDTASSAYQDTIDFADNKSLVELAKNRLVALKNREAQSIAVRQAVTLFVSLGAGWDSNVVGLPRGLQPADYGVEGASALNGNTLLSVDVKNPWMKSWDQRLRGSIVGLKYFDDSLAENFDAGTWDASLQMNRRFKSGSTLGLGVGWNRVLLNAFADPRSLLEIYSLDSSFTNPLRKGSSDLIQSLKVSWTKNLVPSTDGGTADSSGPGIRYSSRLQFKDFAPSSLGPTLAVDWKRSSGTESRYWSVSGGGFWIWPMGGAESDWILNNDIGIKWTNYPTSTAERKDWEFSHSLSLVYAISARFEARSTMTSIWNLSNSSVYGFTRYQLSASLSYLF